MEVNSDKSVVEMDVVETIKGERVFLTFFFRKTKLMLAFIMEKQDQKCVSEVLDYLENLLGLRVFQEIFPVILTDNGGEFKHAEAIEHFDSKQEGVQYITVIPWPHIRREPLRRIMNLSGNIFLNQRVSGSVTRNLQP